LSLSINQLNERLRAFARVDLGRSVTPIDPLSRLGKRLGITLSAKRDDMLALAMGGNKVRQLEYYLGPARAEGADTVLITGAVQSNFVRLTAAAARKLGWHPVVQLEDRVPKEDGFYNASGNLLLDHLLGADIHHFSEGEDEVAADANLERLAEELRAQGRKPYVVHLGIGHPPLGGLGYAHCAAECFAQVQASADLPDHVVVASGSGLTHAGFLTGARALGWRVPVHGICVRRDVVQQTARIGKRGRELGDMLGGVTVCAEDIHLDDAVLAPGYGQMNTAVMDAIRLAAQDEALLVDPVYTGRALAGLVSLVARGVIEKGSRVLFIHTGGTPALFAYQSDLMAGLKAGKGTA
jgi:D-cysteine desulfhydrase family pyridoxal phosphate-dependent enzyme